MAMRSPFQNLHRQALSNLQNVARAGTEGSGGTGSPASKKSTPTCSPRSQCTPRSSVARSSSTPGTASSPGESPRDTAADDTPEQHPALAALVRRLHEPGSADDSTFCGPGTVRTVHAMLREEGQDCGATSTADCMRVLDFVARKSAPARTEMRKLRTHEAVTAAMKRWEASSDEALEQSIRLLGCLAAEDYFDDNWGTGGGQAEDPALAVASAMKASIGSETIQAVGCAALGNFGCAKHDDVDASGGDGGGEDDEWEWGEEQEADEAAADGGEAWEAKVDGILAALVAFPTSRPVAENACFALGIFACARQAAEHMLRRGVLDLAAEVLADHVAVDHVAREACRVVENVVFSTTGASPRRATADTAHNEKLLVHSGVAVAVAEVLCHAVEAEQAIVAQSACAALVNLSSCAALAGQIIDGGGAEAVLRALEAFGDVPRLVEDALSALDNLTEMRPQLLSRDDSHSAVGGGGSESLTSTAGVRVLVNVMANYPEHRAVQLHLCKCLRLLSFDEALRGPIGKLGGIDCLLRAVTAFGGCEDIQDAACTSLANLAHNTDNAHRIAVNDGIRIIVAAMRTHAGSADIQQEATRAIRVLAKISVNRQHLHREGGITAVVEATARHVGNLPLVTQACKALAVITDSSAMACLLFSDGLATLLVKLIDHVGTASAEAEEQDDDEEEVEAAAAKEEKEEAEDEEGGQARGAGAADPASANGGGAHRDAVLGQLTALYATLLRRLDTVEPEEELAVPVLPTAQVCATFVRLMDNAASSRWLRLRCAGTLALLLRHSVPAGTELQEQRASAPVRCILELLRGAPADIDVQAAGLRALATIGATAPGYLGSIGSGGGLRLVQPALAAYGAACAQLCGDCCKLLAGFARSPAYAQATLGLDGLSAALAGVLQQHSGDAGVVSLAFSVMLLVVRSPNQFVAEGVDVRAVCRAMAACAGTASVQETALEILDVACISPRAGGTDAEGTATAQQLVKHGGLGHIVTAVARHRRHNGVVRRGLQCLHHVLVSSSLLPTAATSAGNNASDAGSSTMPSTTTALGAANATTPTSRSVASAVCDVFAIYGGIEVACEAMALHAGDPELQRVAMDIALASSVGDNAVNLRRFVHLDFVSLVLRAMAAHGSTVAVQGVGCTALGMLASKPRFRAKVHHRHGVARVVETLRANSGVGVLQASGLLFLRRMVEDRNLFAAVATDDVVGVTLVAMAQHAADATVHTVATGLLERVAADAAGGLPRLLQAGGVRALLASLEALPGQQAVQASAMASLKLLVCNEAGREAIVACGGIRQVIQVMERFPDAEKMQGYCTFVLAHASHCDECTCEEIIGLGGIVELVGVLQRFPEKSKLCRLACAALGALSQNSTAAVDQILACDGAQHVISAMRTHSDNTEIQKIACALLGNIVRGTGAREKLQEMGATEFVVGVMRKNLEHAQVQTVAVSVLSVLCKHHDAQRRLLGDLGTIDTVLEAMRLHAADVEFQRSSFYFLRSLARVQENRDRIEKLAGVEYIVAAVHARMTPEMTKKIIASSLLSGKGIVSKVEALFTA